MIDRSSLIDAGLADFGLFERFIEAIYTRLVRPGDTVVDGGAHSGLHTLPLARLVGKSGRVIAFEPVSETAQILRGRLRHEMTDDRVSIMEVALGATSGTADFVVVRNATTRSGLREMPYPFAVETEHRRVRVVRLDDVLAGARSLRFVKLDLEGGEYHALMGAKTSLQRFRPFLVFECGTATPGSYGYSLAEFFELFADAGYRVLDLFGDPITQEGWTRRRPWYALGVPPADESFVANELPGILAR